jgi:hypothetical protein
LEKAALKKMEEEEEKDNKRSRKTFFEKLKWIWGYG